MQMFDLGDAAEGSQVGAAVTERQASFVEAITDNELETVKILSGGIASIMVHFQPVSPICTHALKGQQDCQLIYHTL